MMTPNAETYREMLRQEMSVFKPVTDRDEVLACLRDYWNAALDSTQAKSWSDDSRAATLVWSAIGYFVHGDTTKIDRALNLLVDRPHVADLKPCRYYIAAIQHLSPVSVEWSILDDPRPFLEWFAQHRDNLRWDDDKGKYLLIVNE
jgi:hypothetical protein